LRGPAVSVSSLRPTQKTLRAHEIWLSINKYQSRGPDPLEETSLCRCGTKLGIGGSWPRSRKLKGTRATPAGCIVFPGSCAEWSLAGLGLGLMRGQCHGRVEKGRQASRAEKWCRNLSDMHPCNYVTTSGVRRRNDGLPRGLPVLSPSHQCDLEQHTRLRTYPHASLLSTVMPFRYPAS
jgi:hypothetical protein